MPHQLSIAIDEISIIRNQTIIRDKSAEFWFVSVGYKYVAKSWSLLMVTDSLL